MPFAATWMDLKTIILSEVGESDITYTSNLKKKKKDTSELIHKIVTDSQT